MDWYYVIRISILYDVVLWAVIVANTANTQGVINLTCMSVIKIFNLLDLYVDLHRSPVDLKI